MGELTRRGALVAALAASPALAGKNFHVGLMFPRDTTLDELRSLGAAHVIDYAAEDFTDGPTAWDGYAAAAVCSISGASWRCGGRWGGRSCGRTHPRATRRP